MIKFAKNERKVDSMQSKIIFVLLFMLSFSAFHDTFISIIDKSNHKSIVHYMNDEASSSECTQLNEIHNMFHFMAIVSSQQNIEMQFFKAERIYYSSSQHSPPLKKSSYKPPIA